GDLLRAALRDGDVIARYGGEEFALLLVNAGRVEAHAIVERLRAVVEGTDFAAGEGHPGRVTISAGLAEWPRDGAEDSALIAAADAALYRAKAAGRNRVQVA
ncbi:MAG TPA: GGDEF domain-containing protein, partial [Vicinamibacteria bacterium]|nr:GGDEF domain-containing protein [Vicinamibacteria bacterium]